mmetsp:Transcript_26472/g.69034  ORF Transcript_26472/g.69034 Transcript_26472/m.69034 type:complete len:217 (+) Transcript_26472:1546-2196(+)
MRCISTARENGEAVHSSSTSGPKFVCRLMKSPLSSLSWRMRLFFFRWSWATTSGSALDSRICWANTSRFSTSADTIFSRRASIVDLQLWYSRAVVLPALGFCGWETLVLVIEGVNGCFSSHSRIISSSRRWCRFRGEPGACALSAQCSTMLATRMRGAGPRAAGPGAGSRGTARKRPRSSARSTPMPRSPARQSSTVRVRCPSCPLGSARQAKNSK